jgi:hypothetical protein
MGTRTTERYYGKSSIGSEPCPGTLRLLAMSEASGEVARESRSDAAEPLLTRFTQTDRRLLIITIGRTVAANLATVLLVGLAIMAARFMKHAHLGTADWIQVALLPILGLLLLTVSWVVRQTRPGIRVYCRGHLIALAVIAAFFLLVWVGLASGLAG